MLAPAACRYAFAALSDSTLARIALLHYKPSTSPQQLVIVFSPLLTLTFNTHVKIRTPLCHFTRKNDNTSKMSDTESNDTAMSELVRPVDPDDITTTSLEALQGDGQRKILDIVDALRRQGLSGIVELPQLVVCGDQSSGKSSVLEALTEIAFPRHENLCTRFATEIILRRESHSSISTRIHPDKARPESEQEELQGFSRTITDFSQIPNIIKEAEKAMGLLEIGENNRAFARDVLTIEISGPTRPQLTVVDLPGLIHSANKMQSEEDVKLIKELVLDYMTTKRSIILAVISAKNDYANQIVLNHCRAIDPKGKRTLGLITKPDSLTEGTANQRNWLELAQNRDIYFELGWHMVKNRSELEGGKTFVQRNASERSFFAKGAYADLPNSCKGIETLRTRLSLLLHDHLKNELPQLKTELTEKLQNTTKELDQLGVKRNTISEQRMFLTRVGQHTQDLLKSATGGQYDSPFFGEVDMEAAVDSPENIRRLRAVIQHLNLQFSETMHRRGHKYAIPSHETNKQQDQHNDDDYGEGDGDEDEDEDTSDDPSQPIKMTRDEGIDWVQRMLERSRGCELPGNFNPLTISQLFWEQSTRWKDLAQGHIENVSASCKTFVNIVLEEAAPSDIKGRLLEFCVDAALDKSLRAAKDELEKIMADKGRHPMTYNHYFTSKIQDQRKSKYAQILSNVAKDAQVPLYKDSTLRTYIDPAKLNSDMASCIEQNMDRFSAEDALDSQIAYYADELKYFINCVSKQVVERHLVDTLSHNVLSPTLIAGMSDVQIHSLAKEAHDVSRNRERLEERKKVLEKGLQIFKEALGGFS